MFVLCANLRRVGIWLLLIATQQFFSRKWVVSCSFKKRSRRESCFYMSKVSLAMFRRVMRQREERASQNNTCRRLMVWDAQHNLRWRKLCPGISDMLALLNKLRKSSIGQTHRHRLSDLSPICKHKEFTMVSFLQHCHGCKARSVLTRKNK